MFACSAGTTYVRAMKRAILTAATSLLLVACGDDSTQTGGSAPNNGGGNAGGAAAGGAPVVGGAGGEAPVDRCPEVCDKLEAKFATFGCGVEECNCKPACADLFEASIDCIPDNSPACECANQNELSCDGICEAENQAANDCYQAS
jgi:hypothetical protein